MEAERMANPIESYLLPQANIQNRVCTIVHTIRASMFAKRLRTYTRRGDYHWQRLRYRLDQVTDIP